MEDPHLVVEVKALFATLRKVFPKLRRRNVLEVLLSFDGEQLTVDFQGAQYGARARGEWNGMARVSLTMFEAIVKLHTDETIEIEFRNGKLRIGKTSVSAKWHGAAARSLDLSIDAGEGEILVACLGAPYSRVVESGLELKFDRAKRDLAKRVDQACRPLQPYGDFRQQIERIVVDHLRGLGQGK